MQLEPNSSVSGSPLVATPLALVSLYTDGACSGNPGPGGWGVVAYRSDGKQHELGGGELATTNNRMEMQAILAALAFWRGLGCGDRITLYSDSQYAIKGATEWIRGWKRKGWKTASGTPVLNRDLWEEIDRLNGPDVTWRYVRGHAGNVGNERCDAIARAFAAGKSPKLEQFDFF